MKKVKELRQMSADQSSLTEHDMLGMRMASENRAKISFPNICYLGDLGQVTYPLFSFLIF